jgi:thiamine pyrophosphate-dependent acetolactate synthase large subunit-like protein
MLGVEALAQELHRHGVRDIFGIPGKESVRLGVEMQRLGARFHATRHETQAVMMADGYWRASGRIGVALLAQGAGFANGVSGMACAARARSGVVVIAGDLLKSGSEDDPRAKALQALKGVDPAVVCNGIGIANVRPRSARTFVADIRSALDTASAGNAVAINVPSNLFGEAVAEDAAERDASRKGAIEPDSDTVAAVAELLTTGWAASRPVILAGRGAVRSGALPALRRLAERTGALLTTSLMARSSFKGEPYDIGVCGTFSTPVASGLLAQADCVLVFGASLNPFTTYGGSILPKKARVIQIDASPDSPGRYFAPELAIHADARLFAEALDLELTERGHRAVGFRTAEVAEEIAAFDARKEFNDQSADGTIDPRTLMIELDAMLPRKRLLAIDAGLHLHYACTFLEVEGPQDFIFPIDSLAVGLSMGAAIGAAIARPDYVTVLELGDGGLMMSLGDLDTAVRCKLPMVVVVSNDQSWGAESQHLQMLGLPDDYVCMTTPSLAAVAEAMGAEGHTIASPDDLSALRERFREPITRPVVLDCRVDPRIRPASFNFDYAGVFAK